MLSWGGREGRGSHSPRSTSAAVLSTRQCAASAADLCGSSSTTSEFALRLWLCLCCSVLSTREKLLTQLFLLFFLFEHSCMELTGGDQKPMLSQCLQPGLFQINYLVFPACDYWLLENLVREHLFLNYFLVRTCTESSSCIPKNRKYFKIIRTLHLSCDSATL